MTDLTFSNLNILGFFTGKTNDPPVAEFMYAHTHPMTDNFLSEIEEMIAQAEDHLLRHPRKAGVVQKLESMAIKYGSMLTTVNRSTAPAILFLLRDIYQLTSSLPKPKPQNQS